ncbi:MAG: DUF2203 domain-containing protein [Candidatus Dormibacteria bacterium]
MERVFSEDEANGLLPQLRDLLPRVQRAFESFRSAAQTARRHASGNGASPGSVEETGGDYVELLAAVNDLGVILRDPETGLCDFPAIRDDEPVFLCWRLGEERVGFWHPRDAGAAGRQPL